MRRHKQGEMRQSAQVIENRLTSHDGSMRSCQAYMLELQAMTIDRRENWGRPMLGTRRTHVEGEALTYLPTKLTYKSSLTRSGG